jgi:hypothetical protein
MSMPGEVAPTEADIVAAKRNYDHLQLAAAMAKASSANSNSGAGSGPTPMACSPPPPAAASSTSTSASASSSSAAPSTSTGSVSSSSSSATVAAAAEKQQEQQQPPASEGNSTTSTRAPAAETNKSGAMALWEAGQREAILGSQSGFMGMHKVRAAEGSSLRSTADGGCLVLVVQGNYGHLGLNLSTPKFSDINEIVQAGYGFGMGERGLVNHHMNMSGYSEHPFMNHAAGMDAAAAAMDPARRFGGMSPHPHFFSPTMAKRNMEVSAGRMVFVPLSFRAGT